MLTASRASLLSALSLVGAVVERRNTIPILSNVLLARAADPARLALTMTDMDVEAQLTMAATLGTDFRPFTVQAHLLHDIVRKLPDGADCGFEPADPSMGQMRLKAGRSKFALQVLPDGDFPLQKPLDGPCRFQAPAKAFAEALAAVSFAISTEETRYYLNGIFCHPVEEGVMLVATDGHRLAKRVVLLEGGAPADMPSVIIPKKTVGVLAKILPKDGEITLTVSDARISFDLGSTRLSSKLIDGTFPEYQRVVPRDLPEPAIIDAASLRAAVDRVGTVAGDKSRAMKFTFEDGTLTLTVANPDAGNAEETLAYDGDLTLSTGFNSRYVLDVLAQIGTDRLTLSAADASSPAILRATGDNPLNLAVLMPMRA
ncbi:DNA polymerase III subunit beta [Rhizobium sp. SGZ-381]|uniref:DNA polymerase III subunit beta n=1 Tax=Rhizobium sp. SGZ-381 TaxID=3342800 RepID=UPI0036718334